MITCCSISLAEFSAIAFLIVATAYITLCNDLLPHSISLLVWLLILLYYTPYVAQVTCAIYNLIYKLHPLSGTLAVTATPLIHLRQILTVRRQKYLTSIIRHTRYSAQMSSLITASKFIFHKNDKMS